MPDTAKSRQQWPYAPNQKRGCGFPTAQLVGLFCLTTGRLVRFALDTLRSHEIPLARQLIGWIESKEVVLTDRGFCGWGFIALLQRKGADVVMRAHQARKLKGNQMKWAKPQRDPQTWTKSLWEELPAALTLRIPAPGSVLTRRQRRLRRAVRRQHSSRHAISVRSQALLGPPKVARRLRNLPA